MVAISSENIKRCLRRTNNRHFDITIFYLLLDSTPATNNTLRVEIIDIGIKYHLEAAAEWNRRAAEAGDPVGKFNHGLDLMLGWGVARDQEAGRRLVDEAARDGLPVARRLQSADYDLDEVTPDADEWRYQNLF